jgi:hypothetical protein
MVGTAGTAGSSGGAGPAADEFVEIYNPCSTVVDLIDWSLVYRSAAGGSDLSLYKWTSGSLAAHSYVLVGGKGYSGSTPADVTITAGGNTGMLSSTGAGIALKDATAKVIDSVGYGDATNAYVEGAAAPLPPLADKPGNSIARTPNGKDTDDNSADFQLTTTPTPKAAN